MARLSVLPTLPKLPSLFKLPSIGDKPDLNTSSGLYREAKKRGLQKEADEIIKSHSGEEHKKFFEGGFISDIFDVLNVASYGTVGLLKGKTFVEGIENRESFSDKDALGQYGLMGVIGGVVLDIATDPFTYIAPWKILTKVPGFTKAAKLTKTTLLGKPVKKVIDESGRVFTKTEDALGFSIRGKKIEPFRWLADKFVWMHGQDPIFKETYERMMRNKGIEVENISRMMKPLAKFSDKTSSKLLKRLPDGRFARENINTLRRVLSPEEFDIIEPVWRKIDDNSNMLVELGVLGKRKAEENAGIYLKNAYEEFEMFKNKGRFSARALGIKGNKARKDKLTEEMMKDLGQIDKPSYLLFKSMLDQTKDIENAKLFKGVNKFFASNIKQDGFTEIPNTKRFQTSIGKVAELREDVGRINKELKPLFKGLRQTFGGDEMVLKQLDNLEKELVDLSAKRVEELTKFFSAGHLPPSITSSPRKLGIIPEHLQSTANKIKKFDNFDAMDASDVGIELEKLYIHGDLERAGFRNRKEFFDVVKSPYTPAKEGVSDAVIKAEKEFEASYGFSQTSDIVKGKPRPVGFVSKDRRTLRELRLLAKKITDFNRGFRAGAKATSKQINEAQKQIVKVIEKNFDIKDRGRFLKKVKAATSPKKLDDLVKKIGDDFKNLAEKEAESLGLSNLTKAGKLQKQIEDMTRKSIKLGEIDKRSIDDSFRTLEKQINDLQFFKEDLVEEINLNKLGDLAGKWVPEDMATYLNETIDSSAVFGHRIISEFKYMKVVLSPATHFINVVSNKILNWWKLGIGPWRLDLDIDAIRNIATKDEWYKRTQNVGMGANTYAVNELKQILEYPEVATSALKFGSKWGKVKHFMGNIYQNEENLAKLIAFKQFVKKGFKDTDAWKMAESATFNYAQVTPFVRKLRSALWGVPFITFPLKAAPVAIEAALLHTPRVSFFGKFRNAMENLSDIKETEEEKRSLPQHIRDGFFVKLPIKDEYGRSAYFDLTYIIPFGDLLSGQFFERPVGRKTRIPENPSSTLLRKNPALNLIREMSRNETFSGDSIWRESDPMAKQIADVANHIYKTMAPPWIADQMPGGYNEQGERVSTGLLRSLEASPENQKRTLMQELAKNMGLKVLPIDQDIQESINEWNKKKGLQTLLKERGVVRDFSSVFTP